MITHSTVGRWFVAAVLLAGGAYYSWSQSGEDAVEAAQDDPVTVTRPTQKPSDARPARPAHKPSYDSSRFHSAPSDPIAAGDALQVDHPVRLLPPDTVLVAWADDYAGLVAELGVAQLLTRHRASLQKLEDELAEAGLDLFDFTDPSGLGLDASAPAALAMLSASKPVAVAAAAIADPEAVERAIETLTAGRRHTFRQEMMNDAHVTIEETGQPELAFVRRGGYLYVLVGDSWFSNVETAALQIAWQEPDQGLPTTDAWNEAVPFVPSEVGRVFINAPAIYAAASTDLRQSIEQERAELDAKGDEADEWERRWLARKEGEQTLVEAFVGSIGGVAFGVEFSHGRIAVGGKVALREDSMLRGLFRNRTRESPLQRALDVSPVFLLDGAFDRQGLRQVVELIAGAAGGDLDRAMTAVKAFSGIDTDPLDMLTGDLGVAVTLDGTDTWGVNVSVGIADPDAAQRLLESLSRLTPLTGLADPDEETGGLTIRTPHWRTLHVAISGGSFIATTDRSFIDRMSLGTGRLARAMDRPDLGQLMRSVREIGVILYDFEAISPMFVAMPDPTSPSLPEDQTELMRLNAEIARVHRESEAREQETIRGLLGLAGAVAFSGRFDSDAILIQGGLYSEAASVHDLAAGMADGAAALATLDDARQAELAPLLARQRELTAASTEQPAILLD